MWEKKDHGLRVSNHESNIHITLGLTLETCMNTISFAEDHFLKPLQVTIVFQPSSKRSLDHSFLHTWEASLANIFTHHMHLLSVPTTETDQEKVQSSFSDNFLHWLMPY